MSLTTPVRIGIIVADERKYAVVFNRVIKASSNPITRRVFAGPTLAINC